MNITKLIPQPRKQGKYASKKQRLHNWIGYTATVAFTIFYAYNIVSGFTNAQPVEAVMLSPVPTMPPGVTSQQQVKSKPMVEAIPTFTPSPTPGGAANEATKEEVEAYVKQVFKGNSKLAYAVAMVEGYPKGDSDDWGRVFCWYRWDEEKKEHKGEYSVGVFQINIIEGCNGEGDKVHYDRIPGDNLEEKVEWLSNPFNNILFARMLTLEQDGFHAWTGYTSGNYLAHMEGGGN